MIPCEDATCSHKEVFEQIIQDHNHTHENNSDICTPFCICSCCGFIIINERFKKIDFKQFLNSFVQYDFIFSYKENLIPNYLVDFWQPPKL